MTWDPRDKELWELQAELRRQAYTVAAETYEKLADQATGEERDRLLRQAQKIGIS